MDIPVHFIGIFLSSRSDIRKYLFLQPLLMRLGLIGLDRMCTQSAEPPSQAQGSFERHLECSMQCTVSYDVVKLLTDGHPYLSENTSLTWPRPNLNPEHYPCMCKYLVLFRDGALFETQRFSLVRFEPMSHSPTAARHEQAKESSRFSNENMVYIVVFPENTLGCRYQSGNSGGETLHPWPFRCIFYRLLFYFLNRIQQSWMGWVPFKDPVCYDVDYGTKPWDSSGFARASNG